MLDFNGTLIKKLEKNKRLLSLDEKMLGLKILHDNLESLIKIKTAIQDNKKKQKIESVDKKSYLDLITSVTNYMRKKKLDEKKNQAEEQEQLLTYGNMFTQKPAATDYEEVAIRKRGLSEHQFEGESVPLKSFSSLHLYNTRANRLSFDVHEESAND